MAHVIEPPFSDILRKNHPLKGKWHEEFGNDRPIVLELACGKGEYAVGMAQLYPEKNFIGIDIKGARMFSGAKQVEELGLSNVRFLRTKIDMICSFFAECEVDEIWVLFADPQLGRPRKRLTANMFLDRYVQFLKPGGTLHLKSDSDELYDFTKAEAIPAFNEGHPDLRFKRVVDTDQLYESGILEMTPIMQKVLGIKTYYERMWLEQGKSIKYLQYRLVQGS